MIRERIKWLDPLTQGTLILMVGLLVIFLFKKFVLGGIVEMIGALRIIILAKNDSCLIIENDYPREFFIKPKNSDNPVKITPSTPLPIEADGIKINNKVFKLITGTNVKITKDGKIKSYSLFSARMIEHITPNKLNKKEQIQWKKLFEIQ